MLGDFCARAVSAWSVTAPRVLREDSAGVARRRRVPLSEPRAHLIGFDIDIQAALVDVDGDEVALLHSGDRAALRRLRHDVTDYKATSGAVSRPRRKKRIIHVLLNRTSLKTHDTRER